jgi:hypothetical protein
MQEANNNMNKFIPILLISIEIILNFFVMNVCRNPIISLIVILANIFWIIVMIYIIFNKHD